MDKGSPESRVITVKAQSSRSPVGSACRIVGMGLTPWWASRR